jgi:hypothetical protein
MALIGVIKTPQRTGFAQDETRPIVEQGLAVMQEDVPVSNGFFGALDGVWESIGNGLGTAVSGLIDKELDRQGFSDQQNLTSTGDPSDQVGMANRNTPQSFVKQYQTELMIGGGLIAAVAIFFAVKK